MRRCDGATSRNETRRDAGSRDGARRRDDSPLRESRRRAVAARRCDWPASLRAEKASQAHEARSARGQVP